MWTYQVSTPLLCLALGSSVVWSHWPGGGVEASWSKGQDLPRSSSRTHCQQRPSTFSCTDWCSSRFSCTDWRSSCFSPARTKSVVAALASRPHLDPIIGSFANYWENPNYWPIIGSSRMTCIHNSRGWRNISHTCSMHIFSSIGHHSKA